MSKSICRSKIFKEYVKQQKNKNMEIENKEKKVKKK